jgi:rare lipoprotein A
MIYRIAKSSFFILAISFLLFSCATSKSTSKSKNLATKPFKNNVEASYYADKFNGRKTANGEIFNNDKMTCAHRTLAFGTKLKVSNPANNKEVVVTVNDRGPQKASREIDLSKAAFIKIAESINQGVLKVDIAIVN